MASSYYISKEREISRVQRENQLLEIRLKSANEYSTTLETQLEEAKKMSSSCHACALRRQGKQLHGGSELYEMQQQLQRMQLVETEMRPLQQEVERLTAELSACQSQLAGARTDTQRLQAEVSAYRLENETYRDDFRRERADREAAQGRSVDLQKELDVTKTLLNNYGCHVQERRQASIQKIRDEYYRAHPYAPSARHRYIPRGRIVCDGGHDDNGNIPGDDDIIDSLVEPSLHPAASSGHPTASTNHPIASSIHPTASPVQNSTTSFDLQCPKCQSGFSVEEHMAFLEHVDGCGSR